MSQISQKVGLDEHALKPPVARDTFLGIWFGQICIFYDQQMETEILAGISAGHGSATLAKKVQLFLTS